MFAGGWAKGVGPKALPDINSPSLLIQALEAEDSDVDDFDVIDVMTKTEDKSAMDADHESYAESYAAESTTHSGNDTEGSSKRSGGKSALSPNPKRRKRVSGYECRLFHI